MFREPCSRQKYKRTINTYGANQRVKVGRISIRKLHLEQIAHIARETKSSQSCVIETIIKRVLVLKKLKQIAVIRLTIIPAVDKYNFKSKHTVSKELLFTLREIARANDSRLSVVLWHVFDTFFSELCPDYLLLEEYQGN